MELFLLWLMFAITAAVIAGGKGRSVVGWFFLGLAVSIFAVVMVACLPAVERDKAAEAAEREALATSGAYDWLLYAALALVVVMGVAALVLA